MAQHSPPIDRARRQTRPETSAWLILVAFFLVFCALVAAASIAGWRYYTEAMVPVSGALVRVHAPAGVSYRDRSSAKSITPDKPCPQPPASETCQVLKEGDRIQAKPEAGFGPVASLVLPDGSRLADMYAYPTGADLTLTRYAVSRWSQRRQEVELTQAAGYVRYDIPQSTARPYDEITYSVSITENVGLLLAPGGSYSVDVPHYDQEHLPRLALSGAPILAEVAVRSGVAEVRAPSGSVVVRPGEKVQIDGSSTASAPVKAEWQLIRDGDFACGKVRNDRCGAWQRLAVKFDQTVTDREGDKSAAFTVYQTCRPLMPQFCNQDQTINVAQFYREGNQSKSFGIGVQQDLDIDISEYRSLHFSMYARVVKQTVPGAGIANIECPVTIELLYKRESPSDNPVSRTICVYTADAAIMAGQQGGPPPGPYVYQLVPPNSWFQIEQDLRLDTLLPDARYLQQIKIYAVGHDYISEVTDVSIVANQ